MVFFLAFGTQIAFRETRLAKESLAVLALVGAAATKVLTTGFTAPAALVTTWDLASFAGQRAIAAQSAFARIASAFVIAIDDLPAVTTTVPLPIREGNVSAARVVGVQDPVHDLKEVKQSAVT
jgi:hypothetical protein